MESAVADGLETVSCVRIPHKFVIWSFAICVVLPIIGQAFPYGIPIFGPFVFMTLCVVIVSRLNLNEPSSIKINIGVYGFLLFIIITTYLYGIIRTDYFISNGSNIIQDLWNGSEAFMLCLIAVNIYWDAQRLEKCVDVIINMVFVIALALTLGGLYKYSLLQKGVQLSFITAGLSDRTYPWGSSLVEDYNFYALAILCGMLAAMHGMVVTKKWFSRMVRLVAFLAMCDAGFLSGSRRFWVLAPLLIGFGLFWFLRRKRSTLYAIKWFTVIATITAVGAIYALSLKGINYESPAGGLDIKARLDSMLDSQDSYGFIARIGRYEYALGLLDTSTVFFGHGFDYLWNFGCEFGSCAVSDYPHNPILSAFLYGGVLSALITVIFIVYIATLTLKSLGGSPGHVFFGLSLAAEWIFVSISGNTILTVKSLLVTAIVCMLYERYPLSKKIANHAYSAHRY